eukprot:COSAG06_NODE_9711_length_1837_cov_1.539125_3_plen_92_part_00
MAELLIGADSTIDRKLRDILIEQVIRMDLLGRLDLFDPAAAAVCQDRLQLAANVPACFCANALYSLIDQIVDKQTKKVYHRMFVDELRKSR